MKIFKEKSGIEGCLMSQGKICKGLVFRGKINRYINGNGEYVETKRMSPLKRKSCTGCEQCGYLIEEFSECMLGEYSPWPKEIKHNKLYKLMVTNITTDWETGHADSYDIEFVEHR